MDKMANLQENEEYVHKSLSIIWSCECLEMENNFFSARKFVAHTAYPQKWTEVL